MKRRLSEIPLNGVFEIDGRTGIVTRSGSWTKVMFSTGETAIYVWPDEDPEVDYKGQGDFEVIIHLGDE